MNFYCRDVLDACDMAHRLHRDLIDANMAYAHCAMESTFNHPKPAFNGRWFVPIPNDCVKHLIQRKSA